MNSRRHFAYLLRCADGSFYAGYTVNPRRRLSLHERGRASRYTRGRGPFIMAALWRCPSRRAALRLERWVKRLSPARKRRLALGEALSGVLPKADVLGVRRVSLPSSGGLPRTRGRPRAQA